MTDSLPHKIGALVFCPHCGTLLDLPKDGDAYVKCEQCEHKEPASSYEGTEIITHSHPEAFPSALRQKRKTQVKHHEGASRGTLVKEKCPACGNLGAWYVEKQTRSADEGATIFYTCDSCGEGWNVFN